MFLNSIFQLIRKYLTSLLPRNQATGLEDLPTSFFVGQPYVEDPERIDCILEANFVFPAVLSPVEFYLNKNKVIIQQRGSILQIHIYRRISGLLWRNISKLHIGEDFVLPYITKILPEVNRRLLELRYFKGHLLARTFSVMEAHSVFVIHQKKRAKLLWPVSVKSFPPSEAIAKENDEIYIRDYIDAMHSYFKSDFDECIRRVITSTENLFKIRKLRGFSGNNSFRSILLNNLNIQSFSGKVIAENMLFVYKLRNKIVHDKFRIKPSNGWICSKAIGTLDYLLQRLSRDSKMAYYVSSLAGQFLMLQDFLGERMNLDRLEEYAKHRDDPVSPENIINNYADLDRSMFTSLQITEKEKSVVYRR